MLAQIRDIAYFVPDSTLSNEELADIFPDLTAEKIEQNTGIRIRHIASSHQCASDLAVEAARRLFEKSGCSAEDIDYIILCTQSPDHFLPTTACIVQDKLGIPKTCGAFDISLGCSGYVVGLSLAKGFIETGQASNVLVLTADTLTRQVHPNDRSVRTLFGDGAAATIVTGVDRSKPAIGPFVNGTDGKGAKNLIVPAGGMRQPCTPATSAASERENGNVRSDENLYMNGAEIFTFTLREVPKAVKELLARAQLDLKQIDHFVFHQANKYILDYLRKKLGIPEERFPICIAEFGNTSSSTIPITLAELQKENRLRSGDRLLLLGFGVGYSWSGTIITWP